MIGFNTYHPWIRGFCSCRAHNLVLECVNFFGEGAPMLSQHVFIYIIDQAVKRFLVKAAAVAGVVGMVGILVWFIT